VLQGIDNGAGRRRTPELFGIGGKVHGSNEEW
jgi:hypothetical protein